MRGSFCTVCRRNFVWMIPRYDCRYEGADPDCAMPWDVICATGRFFLRSELPSLAWSRPAEPSRNRRHCSERIQEKRGRRRTASATRRPTQNRYRGPGYSNGVGDDCKGGGANRKTGAWNSKSSEALAVQRARLVQGMRSCGRRIGGIFR